MMDYAVVVIKLTEEDGGGYLAVVPDLYGCMSDGDSPEEAVINAQQAIQDWIEVSTELGREIPEPGRSAKRAKEREASLIETIKILAERLDGLDSRIDRLFSEIEHLQVLMENQEAWPRFDRIVTVAKPGNHKASLPC